MPATRPEHRCRVIVSPWPGVYATEIVSARHYARHSHATFGFGVVDGGAQRSASGRGPVDAYAGDVVTTNPGEVHDRQPLGGPSRRWRTVYAEPDVLRSFGPGPELAIAQPVIADAQLQRAIRSLLRAMESWQRERHEALACEEALVAACGLLVERHADLRIVPAAHAVSLARVRERIAADLLCAPTLGELAAIAGIGKFQLLRRFAAVYGCTPHAWLTQHRADHARGCIRRGLGLADAAAASGFADQSHMTRVFTRCFGFTPGAWQAATARVQ